LQEEEEDLNRHLCPLGKGSPPFGALSQRGLDPIKLAYIPSMAGSNQQPAHLTNWVSIPAVLATGPTVTQDSPFHS